jgi:Tfp pilus assembly protein PilO
MKLTSIQKLVLTLLAFVVLIALVVVFAIMPQFAALETLNQQKADAQAQVQQAQAILAQLEEAKTRSAATEAEMLKIGTQLPDSPQLPSLIIEMQILANESGVQMTSFAPSQPTPTTSGQYTEISISTQMKATWDDLLDYMRRLSKTTRLLRVTNVTINPASSDTTESAGEKIPLTVSLTIKAYVMGTNGQLSSAPATATTTAQ